MTPAVAPKWGTLSEAAEHLRLSQRTVRRLISRDEIHARKFGGQVRVDMRSLDDAGQDLVWRAA